MPLSVKQILSSLVIVGATLAFLVLKDLGPLSLEHFAWILSSSGLALVAIDRLFQGPLLLGNTTGALQKKVEFLMDESGVRREEDGKLVEGVAWERLTKVAIMTNDQGPWGEDFFWVLLETDKKGCLVPQSWPRSQELLLRLQKLPRFNHEAVIKASGNTSGGYFECWSGKQGEASILADQ
jgi:hypothetical protein